MKARTAFFLILPLALCGSARGQKEQPLPPGLPPYGPQPPLQLAEPRVSKLDNGLTVWLISQPGLPKLAMVIAVRGGLAADPPDRPGLSELLGDTLDQGTKSRSARQIAEQLQGAGGDFEARASRDGITVSTSVLSADAETALGILSDVVENATFPENEVALAKRNLSDSLKQRESEPGFLANRALAKALFGDNPYGVVAPTEASVENTTAAQLRAEFARRFRPDEALFVAVGDFEPGKMESLLREKLGAWRAPQTPPVDETPRPTTVAPHSVFLVPRAGSVQTTLVFGTVGPLASASDYEAAEVANAIYGGTFSSRLVTNIREDKGYTYSPASSLDTFRQSSILRTQADVRNAVTAPSFNEVAYELNRMATTDPTQEEITKAKRYMQGIEAIILQLRSAVARQLAENWMLELPPDQINLENDKIQKVSAADVDAVSQKYFPAMRMAIVAVGEEKIIRQAFAPFGLPIQAVP
ncbi:MAG TPA: pitrilysin family protein [Candidatus Cybelea sp.]|nr:pitrilysin family protein [Candidatus Cybelea sp.]